MIQKYPVLYLYRKTEDNGQELRYSLRSLKNLKNFDGRVFVVGDQEDWFQHITVIDPMRSHHSPYQDVEHKIMAAISDPKVPNDFILMNDDIYITVETTVRPLHGGEITDDGIGYHGRAKAATKRWLQDRGIAKPLDYSIHVPMIANKQKRLEVHKLIRDSLNCTVLLARNVYGNIHGIGGEYYEDKKTKTKQLKGGEFISTQFFTDELKELFPDRSQYEANTTIVYDDTEPSWSRRYNKIGRENGAKTYTREIIEHQIPIWKRHHTDVTISATNFLSSIPDVKLSALNIQYLHAYNYLNPLAQVDLIRRKVPNTLFVTAYKDLLKHTDRAIFIPMTIDAEKVAQYKRGGRKKSKTAIWFGNILNRQEQFDKTKQAFERNGWRLDYISLNQFNGDGKKLTQEECWKIISGYKYSVGVGRCALEMMALGLKVMFVGKHFGGIMTDDEDFAVKRDSNFATKFCTFSEDIDECIQNFDKAIIRTNDIHDELQFIEKQIKGVL